MGTINRVLQRVELQFGLCRCNGIDSQRSRKLNQVQKNIRQFGANGVKLCRCQLTTLSLSYPLEVFEQLTRLHDKGGREILWRMELLPISLHSKLVELLGEFS